MTQTQAADFEVRLATTPQDLLAAQRLRYEVFVAELGGAGAQVDHAARTESDPLDAFCDHLLLVDLKQNAVVGVYRLMDIEQAEAAGGFYSAAEYDLAPLLTSGRKLLELGRSCLHPDYRGGTGMHMLWSALAEMIRARKIDALFGVASLHGTDIDRHAAQLSLLHHRHLAPADLRMRARPHAFQRMDLIDEQHLDRKAAMKELPGLIKAYLRLGGCVGEGAFIDKDFNTTDVFMVLDTANMRSRQARIYGGAQE